MRGGGIANCNTYIKVWKRGAYERDGRQGIEKLKRRREIWMNLVTCMQVVGVRTYSMHYRLWLITWIFFVRQSNKITRQLYHHLNLDIVIFIGSFFQCNLFQRKSRTKIAANEDTEFKPTTKPSIVEKLHQELPRRSQKFSCHLCTYSTSKRPDLEVHLREWHHTALNSNTAMVYLKPLLVDKRFYTRTIPLGFITGTCLLYILTIFGSY